MTGYADSKVDEQLRFGVGELDRANHSQLPARR